MTRSWILLGLGLAALTGCAGARETEFLDPYTGTTSDEATEKSGRTDVDPAPAGTTGSAIDDDDDVPPVAPPTISPGTNPTCALENDDNDDPERATPFASCIQGSVEGRDEDFLTVTAPADAKQIRISHTEQGRVLYRLEDNLLGYTMNLADDLPLPIEGGETFVFRVTTVPGDRDGARTYELRVDFE